MSPYRAIRPRTALPVVLIVCEGYTERVYVDNFKSIRYALKAYRRTKTDVVSLVKFAENKAKELGINPEEKDSVWCVFDFADNTTENIAKAFSIAQSNSIFLIPSNPCFELWYLLHFKYTTITSKDSVVSELRNHIPNYKKGGDYFVVYLSAKTDTAISNSKKLLGHYSPNSMAILSAPFTQVFKLVEYLRKL